VSLLTYIYIHGHMLQAKIGFATTSAGAAQYGSPISLEADLKVCVCALWCMCVCVSCGACVCLCVCVCVPCGAWPTTLCQVQSPFPYQDLRAKKCWLGTACWPPSKAASWTWDECGGTALCDCGFGEAHLPKNHYRSPSLSADKNSSLR
jgi:hypothetical protein